MGRIKTQLIKRTTNKLIDTNREKFTKDFEHNKQQVQELLNMPSKKLRNAIAGYISRIIKNTKEI